MNLIKVELDRRSPSVRQDLRDCQSMHRSIMRMYGGSRQQAGVLYRVRVTQREAAVYLISEQVPNLPAAAGMKLAGSRQIDGLLAAFAEGQCYSFDLLTAPCKKVSMEGAKNSRRRTLRTSQERTAWLEGKAQAAGFRILWAEESGQAQLWGRHTAETGGEIMIGAVHFRGALCIEDAEKFRQAYRTGIGPGKAYGLGMLLLAPASGG